eukprot:scaffold39474_cov54-Phaeocystis_antarctica.AAC.3
MAARSPIGPPPSTTAHSPRHAGTHSAYCGLARRSANAAKSCLGRCEPSAWSACLKDAARAGSRSTSLPGPTPASLTTSPKTRMISTALAACTNSLSNGPTLLTSCAQGDNPLLECRRHRVPDLPLRSGDAPRATFGRLSGSSEGSPSYWRGPPVRPWVCPSDPPAAAAAAGGDASVPTPAPTPAPTTAAACVYPPVWARQLARQRQRRRRWRWRRRQRGQRRLRVRVRRVRRARRLRRAARRQPPHRDRVSSLRQTRAAAA